MLPRRSVRETESEVGPWEAHHSHHVLESHRSGMRFRGWEEKLKMPQEGFFPPWPAVWCGQAGSWSPDGQNHVRFGEANVSASGPGEGHFKQEHF